MACVTYEQIYQNVLSSYETIAAKYRDAYEANDDIDSAHLDKFLNMVQGREILDMGCGVGVNANYMHKRGYNVYAIDFSEKMLQVGKRDFPQISFSKMDVQNTLFPDCTFDGVVLAYVLNHFDNDALQQVEKEISRVLKSTGRIFISAHMGQGCEFLPDPLDRDITTYYNYLSVELLDAIFSNYKRIYFETRASFGEDELLCDKIFVTYERGA